MSWSGPVGAVPTQLHGDGSGWADCFPASLQFYLRQARKLPLADDVLVQLADVATVVRNAPDSSGNAYVDLSEASSALAHYGLPAAWTDDWATAIASPWAIMLVTGTRLSPANYPPSWFNFADTPDHFICSLPEWQGAYNWFLDPLNPNRRYCQYDLASVSSGFGGAYVLPSTGHGEGIAAVPAVPAPPKPVGTKKAKVLSRCGLKATPDRTSVALTMIPAGGQISLLKEQTPHWQRVVAGHYVGWILKDNIKTA